MAVRPVLAAFFVPVDPDRVLVLLADRLIEYNASTRATRVVKTAAEAGLGRLNQVAGARDGGVWLAAERGIGKLGRPPGSDEYSRWSVYRPGALGLAGFRDLFEGHDGEVFVVGLA